MTQPHTLIIAEAGVNHNGSIDLAKKLVDFAADARADIVKFQSFRADKLASKNAPRAEYQIQNTGDTESQYDMLKRLELSDEHHAILIEYCAHKNIEFLSTPFDVTGMKMLVNDFKLDRIKLGSSELTNAPLLLATAQTGTKLILSTGMGTLEDVRNALSVLAFGYGKPSAQPSKAAFEDAYNSPSLQKILKEKVCILHCTTEYPTPFEDINLHAMKTLSDEFDLEVGFSDHSMGIDVPLAAVALGATIIEKHFTLDRTMSGPDHVASLEPKELKAMVEGIRRIEKALGNGLKKPAPSEMKNMNMARKSLVANRAIAKGEKFTEDNVTIKRPGTGRSPFEYWQTVGSIAQRDFQKDELIA